MEKYKFAASVVVLRMAS